MLFERHAVGGEYQAGYNTVGAGTVETIFTGVLLLLAARYSVLSVSAAPPARPSHHNRRRWWTVSARTGVGRWIAFRG